MRIAMLTNNYKPTVGGVPVSIERLSCGLRRLGHTVTVFAPEHPLQQPEPDVIRVPVSKKLTQQEFQAPNIFDKLMETEFAKRRFDIIHVHHPMLMGYTAVYLGKKYQIPIVFTYHTRYEQYLHYLKFYAKLEEQSKRASLPFLRKLEKGILEYSQEVLLPAHMRYFANLCDLVFAPTDTIKRHLALQGVTTPLALLPTGLPENSFTPDLQKSRLIRNIYAGGRPFLFCTVSRLAKEKNIHFLIKGLQLIKEQAGDNFRLLIIGDGEEKEALAKQAESLHLKDNICFLGCIPNEELKNYYAACDLFLFASKSETQGIVLLEAMAAKTPVVAVKATGVVDVIKNGYNGYMTPEDANLWAKKILSFMQRPETLLPLKKGAFALAHSYRDMDVAKLAQSYYQTLLDKYLQGMPVYAS